MHHSLSILGILQQTSRMLRVFYHDPAVQTWLRVVVENESELRCLVDDGMMIGEWSISCAYRGAVKIGSQHTLSSSETAYVSCQILIKLY